MKQAAIVAVVLVLTGFVAARQDVSDVFYKAVHLQDVKGDLEAAIPLFEQVVAESKDPSLAAKAQLRIGMCYEKLGLTRAQQAYQRVIDRYPQQSQEVAAARARIVALSQPGAAAVVTRRVWTSADGVLGSAPSPDGKYVTFTDLASETASGNLGIRDLNGSKNILLTTEGSLRENQLADCSRWSPDGRQIVYSWWRGTAIELRIVSIDDRRVRVLFRSDDLTWIYPQDWSPDGRYVLASILWDDGRSQLGLISVADGSVRSLRTGHKSARFSPDGRFIVYDRPSDSGTEEDLFVMTVDGGDENTLVKCEADDALVGWSPDGNWVLFFSDRTGTWDLWTVQVVDGRAAGEPRLVKGSIGRVLPLGLARDGSLYYADVKAASDIYTAQIDFSTGKVLIPPARADLRFEGSNRSPEYSPDGRYLAFISNRGRVKSPTSRAAVLCVKPIVGGGERAFAEGFAALNVNSVSGPRWAPDSRSILVAGTASTMGVYRVDIETGKVELVVELPENVGLGGGDWARDGRGFFYVPLDFLNKRSRILYRSLTTGEERQLHAGAAAYYVAPSPDGLSLSIMSQGLLSTMPTSGGPLREIYRFGERHCEGPVWTPDGKSMVFMCMQPGKSTWVLCRIPATGGTIQELGLEVNVSGKISLHPDGQRIAYAVRDPSDTAGDVWVMSNFLPKAAAR
jgi:Tol biopolymer transport system component